jgi:hypothetical protein
MTRVACALAAVALTGAALQAQATVDTPPASFDSAERIRAALSRPPSRLVLETRIPDFSVHIEKRQPMQDIFDVPAWATAPVGWQPPAIGFNLLSVVQYVAKGIAEAKRDHDVRAAREEVARAMTEFCAAQPQSCSTSAASR